MKIEILIIVLNKKFHLKIIKNILIVMDINLQRVNSKKIQK